MKLIKMLLSMVSNVLLNSRKKLMIEYVLTCFNNNEALSLLHKNRRDVKTTCLSQQLLVETLHKFVL